jgi:hypothetical protein
MQNDRLSSFSRKVTLSVMLMLLGMAGCSGGSKLLTASPEPLAKPQLGSPLQAAVAAKAAPVVAPLPLRPRIEPAADLKIVSNEDSRPQSYWCEHFKENSAAEATMLRSPSLAGSYTDGGKGSLNLSMNASSFLRAGLIEESALVKCRKYLAESGLQKLIFVSPQNLTAAGFRAKSDAILAQKKKMLQLRKEIERAMANGAIDHEKATAISILLERLMAEGNSAKSQADRRFNEHLLSSKNANVLSSELLAAESDMDRITSRMRTADNMDVSVQAGWSDASLENGVDLTNQAFSGKVSFSLKLGAIDPRRFEHERKATDLKLRAIESEEGGTVWQIGVLRRAHERAIAGLEESRDKLDFAMKEANHLLAVLASVQQPEFEGARLNTRFEIIKLKADRAGIVGSIAEIKTNLKRLQNG